MDHDERGRQRPTRRQWLAGVAIGTIALAGCVGGDGESDDPAANKDGNNSTAGAGEFDGAEGGVAADAPELTDASVPVLGDPDAPVTLAVYEDFLCPHCRRYNEQFRSEIEAAYLDSARIRYEHRNFPVVHERFSWEAANAARAVFEEYGNEAFWAYKSRLFDRQDEVPNAVPELYGAIANEMGLDGDIIQSAAVDRVHDDQIESDQSRGLDRGIGGTPSFVVDGELVPASGGDTLDDIVGRTMNTLDAALGETSDNGEDSATSDERDNEDNSETTDRDGRY